MTESLRDYQHVGVGFLQANPRSALFLDMGLGKTAIALTALTPAHLPALVIAPKRVAQFVWPQEARRWRPDLTVQVAVGSKTTRESLIGRSATSQPDILVVTRDNLGDLDHIKPKAVPWRTVILDELSSFKNYRTERWKRTRNLTQFVPHVWGLTGTPAPNGYLDLWSQIYLLDRGDRLGKRITHYRERYFIAGRRTPAGVVTEWIPRPETETRVNRLVEDICLSMGTDGRVELPPVTFNHVPVPFSDQLARQYKRLKRESVLDLRAMGGTVHVAPTAAALSSRLAQFTAGFQYTQTPLWEPLHQNKIDATVEIVEGMGSPILVLYRFQAELEMLRTALPQASTIHDKDVIDRWNAREVPVLLAHPASIGHGLNLQHGGHTALWTSLPWSLEEWEQTNKRLLRSGQRHPVVIHILTTPGTVDVAVSRALHDKASIQNALLDYLESPL